MRPCNVAWVALALASCFAQEPALQCPPSSESVGQEGLLCRVAPTYPPLARAARVQGTVVLKVKIDKSGEVQKVKLVSGHPLLVSAAIDAVKQWKFQTYISSGFPVKERTVEVNFTLDKESPRSSH
jgi:periplasmic protein TonB